MRNDKKHARMTRSLAFATLVTVAGCGTANDPMGLLGDATRAPALNVLWNSTTAASFAAAQFTSALGYMTITVTNGVVLAPAAGVVQEATTTSVTIYHSALVTTTLSNFTPSVRNGDYVAAGSALSGTVNAVVQFATYLNGGAVCPYSLMSSDGRTLMSAKVNPACGN